MIEGVVALDSQLLVLLVVGLTSPSYVLKHKKTKAFDVADLDLLVELIGARSLLLLPNTVTEASNHLRWHKPPERDAICETLRLIVAANRELYIASRKATDRPEYIRLGVTDAALLATSDAMLMTADAALHLAAEAAGIASINFNHERELHGLV